MVTKSLPGHATPGLHGLGEQLHVMRGSKVQNQGVIILFR